MSAQKKDGQINLVPRDKFETSLLGRTLKWLLSTFRIIVVLVEMVVMLAFLSRFWLDAKNNDLDDEIKIKMAQIVSQESFEKEFRNIQKRLDIFFTIASASGANSKIVEDISMQLPPDVYLNSLTYTEKTINIKGSSLSEQSIAQFVTNLGTVENFVSTDLEKVDVDEESGNLINFTLSIKTK